MLDVAAGLQAVHDAGLLHRDVKPANVFVTEEGRGTLLDLGLVSDPASTAVTATGNLVGTLRYLAPELFLGEAAGQTADWYAWGATLFELAEGRPLREELPVGSLMAGEELPPPEFERVDPAGSLARVVRACVTADPRARPANLEALRALLEAPAAPAPGVVRTTGPRPPPPENRSGLPRPVMAAGVTALVAAFALAWPRAPAPPPSVVPPVSESPPATLASLAEGALAALRGRSEMDLDPRRYFDQLRRVGGFEDLLEGLRAIDVDPERIDEATRKTLLRFDEELVRRELIPLFGALLRPLPEDAPPVRHPWTKEVLPEGWVAETYREASTARELVRIGLEELASRPEEELLKAPAILAMRMVGALTPEALFSLSGTRENMLTVREVLRPATPHAHRTYVAAFRAVREVEGKEADERAALVRQLTSKMEVNMLCGLANLPPLLLFGGEPRSPAEWFLVGKLQVVQALVREAAGMEVAPLRAEAVASLVRGRQHGGSAPGGTRAQLAARDLLEFLLRVGDREGVAREVGVHRAALRDHPERFRHYLLQRVARAILSLVQGGELPLGELDPLERSLEAWGEAHPKDREIPFFRFVMEDIAETREDMARQPPSGGSR
jgi:hypothetical protein